MSSTIKVLFGVLVVVIVLLGLSQFFVEMDLLGQDTLALCCNNGLCDTGALCSSASTIQSEELLGCQQDANTTCQECIELHRQNKVCGHRNRDAYCMLNGARYYVCSLLSVSISGPDQLDPGESGTFSAQISGGTSPFTYQWYKRVDCYNPDLAEQSELYPPVTDETPCGEWFAIGGNSSSIQISGWQSFSLKVIVTDNCFDSRTAVSPIHAVVVGTALDKLGGKNSHDDLHANSHNDIHMLHNYPNPFNASTTISFSLPEAGLASMIIYNMQGQRIKLLIPAQEYSTGNHQIVWDGRNDFNENAASGLYFCRLIHGNSMIVLRLQLIR